MKQAHFFAVLSFTLAAPMSSYAHGGGQWCIDLSGDIDFYYTLQPPWSASHGKGPYKGCFDDNAAGGAIFIGTEANPTGGNTKLECAFNRNFPNCDISLVDGYSVSVACTAPGGQTFGSGIDLWSQGSCPHVAGSTCKNTNSYAAAQSAVDAFFQPAWPDYWIWVSGQSNSNNPPLTDVGTIKCTVSGGKPGGMKEKREGGDGGTLKDAVEARGLEDLGVERRHAHRARAHSRGLREFLGALRV